MPKYNSRLYYKDKSDDASYRNAPPGTPNIDRLIKGQPCWQALNPKETYRKKTLVLADWTLIYQSQYSFSQAMHKLKKLLEDGFTIYIWEGNDTYESYYWKLFVNQENNIAVDISLSYDPSFEKAEGVLDQKNLECGLDEETIMNYDRQTIFKTFAEFENLPQDQLCIIDDYLLANIENNQITLPPRVFDVTLLYQSELFCVDLVDILKQAQPPIDALICSDITITKKGYQIPNRDTFKPRTYISLDDIQSELPNTHIHSQLSALLASDHNDLTSQQFIDYLPYIKTLTIEDRDISADVLAKILKKATSLTKLKLHNVCISGSLQLIDPLLKLEKLILTDCTISAKMISTLLSHTPNLEILELGDEDLDRSAIELTSTLPKLTSYTDYYLYPSSNAGTHTLSKMPNLKTLTCSWDEESADTIIKHDLLKHLEELQPSAHTITYHDIDKLCNHILTLNVLYYSCLDELDDVRDIIRTRKDFIIAVDYSYRYYPNGYNIHQLTELFSESDLTAFFKRHPDARIINHHFIPTGQSNNPAYISNLYKHLVTKQNALINPSHNAASRLSYKPKTLDQISLGQNNNQTLNQGMIIGKLTQYLCLTQPHSDLILKIQDGICSALSNLYLKMHNRTWSNMIKRIRDWDGNEETLTEKLKKDFDKIIKYINKYQLTSSDEKFFIGDNLNHYLEQHKQSCIIKNPWHRVAIKYSENHQKWHLYDPNYIDGEKSFNTTQELTNELHRVLGRLIILNNPIDNPSIQNINPFIANGGILALCKCKNADIMLEMIKSSKDELKPETLIGLLLRDDKAKPAWARGINHKNPLVRDYIQQLVSAYINLNPYENTKKLLQSMGDMRQTDYDAVLTFLENQTSSFAIQLIDKLNNQNRIDNYRKQLQPWNKKQTKSVSIKKYCQSLYANSKKNQLIEFPNGKQAFALQLVLEQYCHSTNRPVYYINSPNDLACQAPYVQQNHGTGEIHRGPGGKLYNFLTETHQRQPLLIINFENFTPDDIVRFNTLLDDKRRIDGVPLPSNMQVVGLMNVNKPDCYQGSDFYSRFDSTSTCPITTLTLPNHFIVNNEASSQDVYKIDLFHTAAWKQRLLGYWSVNGATLTFVEGELQKAIRSGKSIEIANANWQNTEFVQFWQTAIVRGYIDGPANRISLPDNFNISTSDGYDWELLTKSISVNHGFINTPFTLNPTLLDDYFHQYHCEGNALITLPGKLAQHANQTMHINVTRSLDENEWALFLSSCQEQHIKPIFHCAPNIKLPNAMTHTDKQQETAGNIHQHTDIIISNDIDATLTTLQNTDASQIIDISECKPSDLLYLISGKLNTNTLNFEFNATERALLTALKKNKNIVLKGIFSDELADALAPILLARRHEKTASGNLTILTHQENLFSALITREHHVTASDKTNFLLSTGYTSAQIDQLGDKIETEPYIKLLTQLKHLSNSHQSNDPWIGMHELPNTITLDEFDETTSKSQSAAFIAKRLASINRVLAISPYTFITGITGVGKTSFVERYLNDQHTTLYYSESKLEDWANDNSNQRKILFIDEANIGTRNWSEFEGLLNHPPGMLINGKYIQLTENHKVIFAGNPLNYSNNRHLASLFDRHGNATLFEPLPLAFIYEEILKPTFHSDSIDPLPISKQILHLYRFICEQSYNNVIISPRELQLIALLSRTYLLAHPDANPEQVTKHYIHQITSLLDPYQQDAFDKQFKPTTTLAHDLPAFKNYKLTPSRVPCAALIDDFLSLHEQRIDGCNDIQKYGGLGGIVLEGESGTGKSELVLKTLLARKYHAGNMTTSGNNKTFYHIPVGMQHNLKKQLLLKAFNEGATVIIDEINSSPMMERLLNALLLGRTLEGKKPNNPGFMLIGTQNPITLPGRKAASPAFARRLLKVTLPPYSNTEMCAILESKGLSTFQAHELVSIYAEQVKTAAKHHYTPAPCFRDLTKLANRIVKPHRNTRRLRKRIKKRVYKAPPSRFFSHQRSTQMPAHRHHYRSRSLHTGVRQR